MAREAPEPEAGDARLERAIELFDAGEYHPAHELLDELWEASEGRDADFFKGLIQAAICLHHWQHGNPDGARKLYSGHRRYLAAYLPAHRGIDVAGLLADMQAALGPLLRAGTGEAPAFDAERRPRVPRVAP